MELIPADGSHLVKILPRDRSKPPQLVWSKSPNAVPFHRSLTQKDMAGQAQVSIAELTPEERITEDERIIDHYFGISELRKGFHIPQETPIEAPVIKTSPVEWKKIREEIKQASIPPFTKLEKAMGVGIIGFLASHVDDILSVAAGNALAYGIYTQAPQMLALEGWNFAAYPIAWVISEIGFLNSCVGSMHHSYELIKKHGGSNSGGAYVAYEFAKKITEDPAKISFINRFTTTENFERKAHHVGYWFMNSQKELYWLAAYVGLPIIATQTPFISDYLATWNINTKEDNIDAAGWVALVGANLSGIAYQTIQERILRGAVSGQRINIKSILHPRNMYNKIVSKT